MVLAICENGCLSNRCRLGFPDGCGSNNGCGPSPVGLGAPSGSQWVRLDIVAVSYTPAKE